MESAISSLKLALADHLLAEGQVQAPLGCATGIGAFDEALLWKGFPRGEVTLAMNPLGPGVGLTSLWLSALRGVHGRDRWGAWVNSSWRLYPSPPFVNGLRWDRLVVLDRPARPDLFFWILQEVITSELFELVGCHLPDFFLRPHQVVKLKSLARSMKVALVLITERRVPSVEPLCALVIEARERDVILHRALHRATPRLLSEVLSHACSLPALSQRDQLLLG